VHTIAGNLLAAQYESQETAAAGELFHVEELVLFDPVHG
jgi:hypothetical protein